MNIKPAFGTEVPNKADYDTDRAIRKNRAASPALQADGPISLDAQWRNIWPARDQFGRGTCVAFGTIAAIELMRACENDLPPKRLSEQFMDQQMKSKSPLMTSEEATMPDGGLLLRQAWFVIENVGLVDTAHVPYRSAAHAMDHSGPPASAEIEARGAQDTFKCVEYGRIGQAREGDDPRTAYFSTGQDMAQRCLDFLSGGYPVVVGIPLFLHPSGLTNWTLPSALAHGLVHCPEDADSPPLDGPRFDGHVVCLTGFVPDEKEPMGGWFTFRNSWGTEFAARSLGDDMPHAAKGRGNGRLSATYLNEYCWEYLVPGPLIDTNTSSQAEPNA